MVSFTTEPNSARCASAWLATLGLAMCATAQAYNTNDIIATYAGNATQGYSGDGGAAVAAMLNEPALMAVDAAGNVYVSDIASHTIRKISTSGIITTIAGTGTAGYNGDGIPATTAQLNTPSGLAFDTAGNLYVADSSNERIRMIAAGTGIISTIAGTGAAGCNNSVAGSATFFGPIGLAFDGTGTLYISELGNKVVRKLSAGSVSAFAGVCGTSGFQLPWGVATDGAGNVYVADDAGKRVYKVDHNGNQAVFAGNGAGGNMGDGSLATAPGTTLSDPLSVTIDSAGDVYIASGTVVRVVTPDGIIHTAVGSGPVGNAGDGGLATNANLNGVAGLVMNAAGRLFIADELSSVVRIVGPASPVTMTVVGDGFTPSSDNVRSADGRIACPGTCGANYVRGMPVIFDVAPTSPDFLYQWSGAACAINAACTLVPQTAVPTAVTARFTPWYIDTLLGGTKGPTLQAPFALTFDAQDNMYFTETGDCVVRRRSATGVLTTIAGNGVCGNIGDGMPATQGELSDPLGVAVDAAGAVYIHDTGNGDIRKVAADGVLRNLVTNAYSGFISPALVVDSAGDLFTVGSNTTVVRITPDGSTNPFAEVADGKTTFVTGLASANGGNLVASGTYQNHPAFTYISAQGVKFTSFYYPDTNPAPIGVAVNRLGVQFNEFSTCEIYTTITTNLLVAGYEATAYGCGYDGDGGPASAANLNDAVGLAFDSKGYLYVADTGNNAIRKIYPDAIFTGTMEP